MNNLSSDNPKKPSFFKKLGFLSVLIALFFTSLYSYLLFHSLAEMFSIAVAWGIFFIAWNTRHISDNHALLFLGIAYCFIGFTDLLHTLAYKGMGVFPDYGANLPTQLWIFARYLEAFSFLIAPVFINRKVKPFILFISFTAITLFFIGLIFLQYFPDCFIDGSGLTFFKKKSEFIIILIFIASVKFLLKYRSRFDNFVLRIIIISVILKIFSEIAFIFYISVYDISNMIGHYLKIISFYFIYKAIIETGLSNPINFLFRELKETETKLQRLNQELECRVRARTCELTRSNEQLEKEIAERKKIEAALSRSEELFRNTFEQATVGIAHVSPEGKWLRVNKEVCRITGYPSDELLQCTFQDITYPDDLEKNIEYVRQILNSKISKYSMEKRYIRKDKSFIWVLLTVSLIRDASGNPEYFISVIRDISEQKHARQLIAQRNAELENMNQELNDFTHIVSHDLRTPLRGIYNFSDILIEEYAGVHDSTSPHLDEKAYSILGNIKRLTKHLDDQVAALLKYSRIGRLALNIEETDINLLIHDLIDLLKLSSPLVQVSDFNQPSVDIRILNILPIVKCDKTQIQILFQNLIDNALKYNDKKEKWVEIGFLHQCESFPHRAVPTQSRSHAEHGNEERDIQSLIFFVRDNGIGIQEKYFTEIFKIFRRLHSREIYDGTGVGLTIVKKIIDRHNGRIWIESEPGKGSAFYFTLNDR